MDTKKFFERITIVMPAYNSESYIRAALQSLTLATGVSVILVDDGSTDRTIEIAKSFNKDLNLKIISNNHGGVSAARNSALPCVTTDYVMFMDADDVFSPDGFTDDILKSIDLDVHFIDISSIHSNTFSILNDQMRRNLVLGLSGVKNGNSLEYLGCAAPFSKIFKTSIIMKNNIRFNEDIVKGEDAIFIMNYLLAADNIALLFGSIYGYRQHDDSVTNKLAYDILNNYYAYVKELKKILTAIDMSVRDEENIMALCVVNDSIDCAKMNKPYEFKLIKKDIEHYVRTNSKEFNRKMLVPWLVKTGNFSVIRLLFKLRSLKKTRSSWKAKEFIRI